MEKELNIFHIIKLIVEAVYRQFFEQGHNQGTFLHSPCGQCILHSKIIGHQNNNNHSTYEHGIQNVGQSNTNTTHKNKNINMEIYITHM